MATTKLQELPNGTFITTIPRPFAELLKLKKGDTIDWHPVFATQKLELSKVKRQ